MIFFKYFERVLSFVPRWTIAPHINKQSVAEHSYYVTLYTSKIAGFKKWPNEKRWIAMEYALRHDAAEYRTGDIPGPVKKYIVDPFLLKSYEDTVVAELGPDYGVLQITDEEILSVVKTADIIDTYLWLCTEVAMGNLMLDRQRMATLERLRAATDKIDCPDIFWMVEAEGRKLWEGLELPEYTPPTRPSHG